MVGRNKDRESKSVSIFDRNGPADKQLTQQESEAVEQETVCPHEGVFERLN